MVNGRGDISNLFGKDSQRLNFVLFIRNDRYVLRTGYIDGLKKQTHEQIALEYLVETGQNISAFQLNSNPINLGVRGGGIIEWHQPDGHRSTHKIIFYGGSQYGNPTIDEIKALMENNVFYDWESHPQSIELAYSFW